VSPRKSQLPPWVKSVEKSAFFVVETEGALFTYVHEDDWVLAIPFVPIYGQSLDGVTVIWDRIVSEMNPWQGALRISVPTSESDVPLTAPAKKT
jgi:hypothetical protein